MPPNTTATKVFYEYVYLENLEIKEGENKIELCIKMRAAWEDHRIEVIPSFSNFVGDLDDLDGIYIPGYLEERIFTATIWKPGGIKPENITQLEQIQDYAFLSFIAGGSLMAHYSSLTWPFTGPNTIVVVTGTYWKISLPCNFDTATFPFDTHYCKLIHSNKAVRKLFPMISPLQEFFSNEITKTNSKFGFAITPSIVTGKDVIANIQFVGLTFKMKRVLSPLLLQNASHQFAS